MARRKHPGFPLPPIGLDDDFDLDTEVDLDRLLETEIAFMKKVGKDFGKAGDCEEPDELTHDMCSFRKNVIAGIGGRPAALMLRNGAPQRRSCAADSASGDWLQHPDEDDGFERNGCASRQRLGTAKLDATLRSGALRQGCRSIGQAGPAWTAKAFLRREAPPRSGRSVRR